MRDLYTAIDKALQADDIPGAIRALNKKRTVNILFASKDQSLKVFTRVLETSCGALVEHLLTKHKNKATFRDFLAAEYADSVMYAALGVGDERTDSRDDKGIESVVSALLKNSPRGADRRMLVNVNMGGDYNSPLEFANKKGLRSTAKVLREHGAR